MKLEHTLGINGSLIPEREDSIALALEALFEVMESLDGRGAGSLGVRNEAPRSRSRLAHFPPPFPILQKCSNKEQHSYTQLPSAKSYGQCP